MPIAGAGGDGVVSTAGRQLLAIAGAGGDDMVSVGRNPNMARFPDPSGNGRVGHPAFPTFPKL